MYNPILYKQFEKDVKCCQIRGKNLDKFKILTKTLLSGKSLDSIHNDHKLVVNYVGWRDCNIESE